MWILPLFFTIYVFYFIGTLYEKQTNIFGVSFAIVKRIGDQFGIFFFRNFSTLSPLLTDSQICRKFLWINSCNSVSAMDMYGFDSSLFEFGFTDPSSLIDSISNSHPMITDRRYSEREEEEEENLLKLSSSILENLKRDSSPPRHRHDGTSPLPLGMDWSPPPRCWVISVIYGAEWIFF